ncbi:MAG TPA: hypothetical protein PLL69_12275 [Gemmatimonadales bacterium]|nr:hypothetical protein [Gemmatimonadales bacterium]
MPKPVTASLLMLAALIAPFGAASGQSPVPPVTNLPSVTGPRPSPLNYFARSLLLPGWGQASLDRKLSGGLFLMFEGVALGMALKASSEIGHLERTGSERLEEKRQERQDWLFLLAMNHLFSGLEAFVAANLYDFPGDLGVQPLPGGRTGFALSVPVPR